jgi:catechol 2,3-dioxygenase-like lactoylglutathione lyase family enzyme
MTIIGLTFGILNCISQTRKTLVPLQDSWELAICKDLESGVRALLSPEPFCGKANIADKWPPTPYYSCRPDNNTSLCFRQVEEKATHLHLAFTAENRQQVLDFHRAELQAGAKNNGEPGLRPQYHANYYAAFVIGPDGHNIEVVCLEPEA